MQLWNIEFRQDNKKPRAAYDQREEVKYGPVHSSLLANVSAQRAQQRSAEADKYVNYVPRLFCYLSPRPVRLNASSNSPGGLWKSVSKVSQGGGLAHPANIGSRFAAQQGMNMKTTSSGNLRSFSGRNKVCGFNGEVSGRKRKRFERGIENIWRIAVDVFGALFGRDDHGEWAVGANPYDRVRCRERAAKVIELQAQIQDFRKGTSAPPMLTSAGKRELGWEMNVHITANYLHWMTKRMAQNARDNCMFAAKPPEVSRWLWWLRQKMICFWRYRILEGLKKL